MNTSLLNWAKVLVAFTFIVAWLWVLAWLYPATIASKVLVALTFIVACLWVILCACHTVVHWVFRLERLELRNKALSRELRDAQKMILERSAAYSLGSRDVSWILDRAHGLAKTVSRLSMKTEPVIEHGGISSQDDKEDISEVQSFCQTE